MKILLLLRYKLMNILVHRQYDYGSKNNSNQIIKKRAHIGRDLWEILCQYMQTFYVNRKLKLYAKLIM